jgi:hypothetical protein
MDLSVLPALTGLNALTEGLGGVCYLAVGIGAWLYRPRDVRTRVFLFVALANAVVFGIPTVAWLRGLTDPAQASRSAGAALVAALGLGALLLFHFTQVFPVRRPWIRGAGIQLWAAYLLIPAVVAGLTYYMPPDLEHVSNAYLLALLVFGFPMLVLLGLVLPVVAILSLVRSHRDMAAAGLDAVKKPVEWLLVSQIGGGTLSVVFAPVFQVLAPMSGVNAVLTVAIWALGLLTPIAFAAAVWKYGVLSLDGE